MQLTNLWLECSSSNPASMTHGATTHHPQNCLFCAQPMYFWTPESTTPTTYSYATVGPIPGNISQPGCQLCWQLGCSMGDLTRNSLAINSHNRLTTPLTAPFAIMLPVAFSTCVYKRCGTSHSSQLCPWRDSQLSKLTLWTLLRLLILERELSNHPNKAFVKQLINDPCHGCSNGYKGS